MTAKGHSVLIVDDEPAILRFLRVGLQDAGFRALVAADGTLALEMIERDLPDLIILDIMMPSVDGIEVCQRLRGWSQIPIIMLSARGDERDKVKCLELGADDYITKPFGLDELIARVRAVLRRTEAIKAEASLPCFRSNDLTVDFAHRKVTLAGAELQLTPTEYSLLQELALNAGKVLTHVDLLKRVWGSEYESERQYLHVFINRLRAKLQLRGTDQRYLTTVPGVGYKLEAPTC
jgi:two-component system KDP operon response regulator KdpE